MDREEIKLKFRNFWRKNRKLITMVSVAAIVGLTIASFNIWSHRNSVNKFQLEEEQTISNQEDAVFRFQLEEPSLASGTTLRTEIEGMESGTELTVSVNNQDVNTITKSEAITKIENDVLQNDNTVRIYKEEPGFNTQTLVDASVTSTTNFNELVFVLLNLLSITLIFVPVAYLKYQDYIRKQRIEDEFPEFLRDVVHGTRAGMSLPQAIQNTESGSYGPLSEEVEKMSAQLEWGIPFDEVLNNFADKTDSPLIRRSVDTIIQAYTSGGNIEQVLESVGENIRSIKQLKEERQSQLYGEMVTGYIVYFIFIGILIALTSFLLPSLAEASQSIGGSLSILGGGNQGRSLQQNIKVYRTWFTRLVYLQAIFSGIIIGKLSEGEFKAGIKHTFILFASGYLAVTLFL